MADLNEALRRAGDAACEEWDRWEDRNHGRCNIADSADALVKAALASLARDGWVLVPREATECMVTAGNG